MFGGNDSDTSSSGSGTKPLSHLDKPYNFTFIDEEPEIIVDYERSFKRSHEETPESELLFEQPKKIVRKSDHVSRSTQTECQCQFKLNKKTQTDPAWMKQKEVATQTVDQRDCQEESRAHLRCLFEEEGVARHKPTIVPGPVKGRDPIRGQGQGPSNAPNTEPIIRPIPTRSLNTITQKLWSRSVNAEGEGRDYDADLEDEAQDEAPAHEAHGEHHPEHHNGPQPAAVDGPGFAPQIHMDFFPASLRSSLAIFPEFNMTADPIQHMNLVNHIIALNSQWSYLNHDVMQKRLNDELYQREMNRVLNVLWTENQRLRAERDHDYN